MPHGQVTELSWRRAQGLLLARCDGRKHLVQAITGPLDVVIAQMCPPGRPQAPEGWSAPVVDRRHIGSVGGPFSSLRSPACSSRWCLRQACLWRLSSGFSVLGWGATEEPEYALAAVDRQEEDLSARPLLEICSWSLHHRSFESRSSVQKSQSRNSYRSSNSLQLTPLVQQSATDCLRLWAEFVPHGGVSPVSRISPQFSHMLVKIHPDTAHRCRLNPSNPGGLA